MKNQGLSSAKLRPAQLDLAAIDSCQGVEKFKLRDFVPGCILQFS